MKNSKKEEGIGKNLFPENHRGWVKIVEAFVAILLITGVLLIVIDKEYIGKEDISSKVYDTELSILREIQSDDELRKEILDLEDLPVEWEDFPADIENQINNRVPNYLICVGKICEINDACILEETIGGDVYAKSVPISSTLETYSPRKLKLFCWVRIEEPVIPNPIICENPEGKISFMGGYPVESLGKIKFKVFTELTSGEFNLRIYYDTETYVDGISYDVSVWNNVEIVDPLDWPESGSVITIQYNGQCQDKYETV